MPETDYHGAIAHALARLRSELSPQLSYHGVWHTEHEVLPATLQFARLSGLSQAEIDLLQVAAAYHDIGWIETFIEHERLGATIAAQILPQYGFNPDSIEQITAMIMATRLPQSPHTLSEAILADADLDVLGRDDFLVRNRALRQELAMLGRVFTDHEWMTSQKNFLQQHTYFTPAARALRAAQQQANLVLFVAEFQ